MIVILNKYEIDLPERFISTVSKELELICNPLVKPDEMVNLFRQIDSRLVMFTASVTEGELYKNQGAALSISDHKIKFLIKKQEYDNAISEVIKSINANTKAYEEYVLKEEERYALAGNRQK